MQSGHTYPRAAPFTLTTQGARNVRCSVCGYINNVSMLWRGLTPAQEFARSRNLAQITCIGCRTTLLYPQGASAVQCAVCRTLNPVRPVREFCYFLCCLVELWGRILSGVQAGRMDLVERESGRRLLASNSNSDPTPLHSPTLHPIGNETMGDPDLRWLPAALDVRQRRPVRPLRRLPAHEPRAEASRGRHAGAGAASKDRHRRESANTG